MKHTQHLAVSLMMLAALALTASADALEERSRSSQIGWQRLEPGLDFGVFAAPQPSEHGDSFIRILRIDPAYFELRLLTASSFERPQLLTAREWGQRYQLVAAINASMYQKDYLTSVSFMRTKTHVNNPRLSKDNTILAFDPLVSGVPLVKIIDRQCENFEDWQEKYTTFVQSIRMISCQGRNVWRQRPQKSSTAAIGIDRQGRVLFIHVRSLYSTHDVIEMLLHLPLELSQAMYAEGGGEAQLYVKSGEHEMELLGDYGNRFGNNSGLRYAWPIPNVLGIVRRPRPIK